MKPVVPTTAWTPCAAHQRRFSRAAPTTVKSTATSTPASTSASGFADDLEVGAAHPELVEIDARVVRVDRRDELELGVVEHRPAHGRTHAPTGAEHPDPDHRPEPTDQRPPDRRDDSRAGPVTGRRAADVADVDERSVEVGGVERADDGERHALAGREHPVDDRGARRRR